MTNNQKYIDARTIETAKYMIDNCCTIRDTAKHFGVSKSTIHACVHNRLPNLSAYLNEQVNILLNMNKEERTIRGGMATKNKWKMLDNKC